MRKMRWLTLLTATCIGFSCLAASGLAKQQKQKTYPLGDFPLPEEVYKKKLKFSALDMAGELPARYDAREDGLVTAAKNQGSCGSCWAFASVGAMESHLLKAYGLGPEDLSEQQQVSCNTAMYGCSGGSSTAIRYWEGKGAEDEAYFPYTASDATVCKEESAAQLGYRVTNWHTVPVTANDFKTSLYNDGPSYWRYNVHGDFYTYWNTAQAGDVYLNSSSDYRGGHAVLLIGWDDSKGAYLCKNSWGENNGPNGDGTFWIAYSGHAVDLNFGMANFSLTAVGCASDGDCDDGVACNGQETCVSGSCQAGIAVICPDDGIFCNGAEACAEDANNPLGYVCNSVGDPCGTSQSCDEDLDQCISGCGNGICESGENCSSCPSDCISGANGGTCGACFKGKCDDNCHPTKEDSACSDCWSTYCCGDGVCEGAENLLNCAVDCK